MSTTAQPARRTHPLSIAAFIVLGVGLAATALLLLLPMTAAGAYGDSSCGSVVVNNDPNRYAGEAPCADALDTRRTQAIVVFVVTMVAAGALGAVRVYQKDEERLRAKYGADT